MIVAEVGAVEGNKIEAFLRPKSTSEIGLQHAPVTYAVVLPFSGLTTNTARGYVFRLAGVPILASPSPRDLEKSWNSVVLMPKRNPSAK
ncbi:hypothetical protein [Dankookia sp. P2]|uniref:hypothetical protein n=1 Tax=Dankookia sp. P2 TaxID=3423955 RepID=UPI003D667A87